MKRHFSFALVADDSDTDAQVKEKVQKLLSKDPTVVFQSIQETSSSAIVSHPSRCATPENNTFVKKEVIIDNLTRIRDVETGSDGAVYLLLEHNLGGKIVKLVPATEDIAKR